MDALERVRQVREAVQEEWGNRPVDIDLAALIDDIREERDAEFLDRSD